MANISWVLNDSFPVDFGMEFLPAPLIYLAAVEASDTAKIYFGSTIVATESPDQASLSINTRSITLAAIESSDTALIDILQGELVEVSATEAGDTASVNIYSGILVRLAVAEKPDRASVSVLVGTVAEIEAIESADTALVAFSASTLIELAGVEDTDSASLFISEAPITYNRMAAVMHLFTHAVTEYKNFNFNSLAYFKNQLIGANETGIFLLDGENDLGVGIEAFIRSGTIDFASDGVIKLPKEAWIAERANGALELEVRENEGAAYSFDFDRSGRDVNEARAKLGRGLRKRFYTFALRNKDGSHFDLESFRVLGDVIARKRR